MVRLAALAAVASLLWPLDAHRALTGSFGEYRSSHPHAGVDISTGGRVGFPVRAAADAWVSKIRRSRYGYGNVVYLKRDEGGYVVYAHLDRFSDRLEGLFDGRAPDADGRIEVVPPPGRVRVERGEVIAYTGESGSGPPHLHFEVRDDAERPLNPLTHGADLEDREPPTIHAVILEPAGPDGRVEGVPGPVEFRGVRRAPVRVRPPVRALVVASDGDGRGRGRLGLHRAALEVDGERAFTVEIDRFSYPRQREVGLVYDPYRTSFGEYVYRLYDAGGAREMTRPTPRAVVAGRPGRRDLVVRVADAAGNEAAYRLAVDLLAADSPGPRPTRLAGGSGPAVHPMDGWIGVVRRGGVEAVRLDRLADGAHEIGTDDGPWPFGLGRVRPEGGGVEAHDGGARLRVPPGAAYRPAEVIVAPTSLPEAPRLPTVRGPYAFHPLGLPFDKPVRVEFRPPPLAPRREQLGVYRWDAAKGRWRFEDDVRDGPWIGADVPFLAPFALLRDAVAPRVVATEPAEGARVRSVPRLTVTFDDVGSGLDPASVRATLDGRPLEGWFDPDHDRFIHETVAVGGRPRHALELRPGRHRVEIEARDRAENAVRHAFSFEVLE